MMQLVEFSIYHEGCPACMSTERFPEVGLYIMRSTAEGNGRAKALQRAVFPDEANRAGFLNYWRNSPIVTRYEPLSGNTEASIFHVSLHSGTGWVTDSILSNNGYFLDSTFVQDGVERWRVLIDDSQRSSLFEELGKIGIPRLESTGPVKMGRLGQKLLQDSQPELTGKQEAVIRAAFERGYFDRNRKIGSRELARELGLSQSTLLEHLRKAQHSIFSMLLGRNAEVEDEPEH